MLPSASRWLLLCTWLVVCGCGGATLLDPPQQEPVFVAVGADGTVLTSPDAESWTAQSSGTLATLNHVAVSRTSFVAVGEDGTILTSRDGAVWTAQRSGTHVDLTQVVFEGEQFVAVGGGYSDEAVALTSSDGVTWKPLEAPPEYSFQAVAIAGGSIFTAAVTPSKDLPMALDRVVLASVLPSTSNRGGWIARELPSFSDSLEPQQAGGETLLVGSWDGESTLSRVTDAESWTTEALPLADAAAIASSGSDFVIVGAASALHSSDGVEWIETSPPVKTGNWLTAVAHGVGRFVAVGLHGTILTSSDGSEWSAHDSGARAALLDVTFRPAAL